ncbi:hypothetical protein [Streptomyces sp. NPDC055055]
MPDRSGAIVMRCDLCGTSIPLGSEIHALVADSSAVHVHDPLLDGRRIITACSLAHLAELRHDAELWAGRIALVLQQHPDGLSTQQLAAATGLTTAQVGRALAWQRNYRRSGDEPTPPTAADRE